MHIVMLGRIGAGFPRASEGYEEQGIDLQKLLVTHPASTFFFRVVGDSHKVDGVPSGAVLVVDRSVTPKPGLLVVSARDGEFIVEHLRAGDETMVQGVVTASIVRLR
ncbi:MAG: hypothetical protein K8R92_10210 [Planctomycetes bacterium]|nr:hypothetical protein [Planctomycetota bacterium]